MPESLTDLPIELLISLIEHLHSTDHHHTISRLSLTCFLLNEIILDFNQSQQQLFITEFKNLQNEYQQYNCTMGQMRDVLFDPEKALLDVEFGICFNDMFDRHRAEIDVRTMERIVKRGGTTERIENGPEKIGVNVVDLVNNFIGRGYYEDCEMVVRLFKILAWNGKCVETNVGFINAQLHCVNAESLIVMGLARAVDAYGRLLTVQRYVALYEIYRYVLATGMWTHRYMKDYFNFVSCSRIHSPKVTDLQKKILIIASLDSCLLDINIDDNVHRTLDKTNPSNPSLWRCYVDLLNPEQLSYLAGKLPLDFFLANKNNRKILSLLLGNDNFRVAALGKGWLKILLDKKEKRLILSLIGIDSINSIIDEDGNTPILYVSGLRGVTHGIVFSLYQRGANLNDRNYKGESCYDRAKAINNKKLASILQETLEQ